MENTITKKELAMRHGVSERAVDNWIRKKGLKFLKFGNDIVFKESDLEEWGRSQADLSKKVK